MHILCRIDTNPVTYPIDACWRRRLTPMLSHILHGRTQAPYLHICTYILHHPKHTKILSLLYQIKNKIYYNKTVWTYFLTILYIFLSYFSPKRHHHFPYYWQSHDRLFSSLSSPQLVNRGFVQTEAQIQILTSKINPHLFHLHHSHIGPILSQTCRNYFLIHKNPKCLSYRHTSINRYHCMYTKNLSSE